MSSFVKLGDLTHIRTGKLDANASSENGQYPFFTCSKEPLRIASYSYDCECVLVAGNGDLNVKYYDGKFDAYQRTYIIESADKRKLLVKYLYFFLDIYVEVLRTQSIGGVIKYIKLGNLTDAHIPLPSIERQAEIIECLENCNTLIDKRQRQIALIEQTVKSRFIELFGDPEKNPKGWPVVNITEIIGGKVSNGFFAKREAYRDDGNVQVLGVANIVNRMYSNIESLPRTNATQADEAKYAVKYGDMLFCRSSLVAEGIGKASIVPKGAPHNVLFECHVIRLPLDLQKCIPEFVQVLSTTDFFRRQIIAQSKTATMTTIGQDGILKSMIILPPIEQQREFLRFVEQTDKSKYYSSLSFRYCQAAANTYRQEWMTCRTSDF